MTDPTYLGELEQMVLWAVLRLEGDAYGPLILEELGERVGRTVSPGALYATLDRLETKGMLRSTLADPEPRRGGRPRRYVSVTAEGREALARVRSEWMRLWAGLDVAAEEGG
ncbi:MAG TPA: PadR family transcriptional regulator [Longimicrobiales bacterium]|jgi:DNA-binding PadR family transcriptional regulator